MTIFILVVGLVLAAASYGLYRRLAVATALPRTARRTVAGVLGLGWAAILVAFATSGGIIDPSPIRPLVWAGMTWAAVCVYLVLGVLALGILCLAARPARSGRARRVIVGVGTPLVVLTALGLTAQGVAAAAAPQITTATVTNDQLPEAFDGLRVALITDLHAGPVRDARFTQLVVDRVNAMQPDLVVLGGDLADGTVEQVSDTLAPLAHLTAPDGVVAVSGNHEFISGEADAWLAHWETLGVTPLRNEHVTLTRSGVSVTVAGINDPSGTGADAPDIDAALAGTDPAGFTTLVAHQPRAAFGAQGRGVDLQLSGHTHGGQLWPFRYAVLLQQPVIDGLAPVGDIPVLTSRGAGAWGSPVRVGATPEIPIITLRRG